MKIIVINGVNLNLLGLRNKDHYGAVTLEKIERLIKSEFPDIKFDFFQSNIEGEIVNQIHGAIDKYDGLIINPGAYSHTSIAIRDALEILSIPKVEVHLSNLSGRDQFRQTLMTAPVCSGYVSGFKEDGYLAAVYLIRRIISKL